MTSGGETELRVYNAFKFQANIHFSCHWTLRWIILITFFFCRLRLLYLKTWAANTGSRGKPVLAEAIRKQQDTEVHCKAILN